MGEAWIGKSLLFQLISLSVKSLSICYSDSLSDSEEEFNNFEVKTLKKEENSATNSEAEIIKEDSEKKHTTSKKESPLKKVPKKKEKRIFYNSGQNIKKRKNSHPYHYWMAWMMDFR